MNKKILSIKNAMTNAREIMKTNKLSDTARAMFDEFVAAVDALAEAAEEHNETSIQDEFEKIAAKYATSEEVANQIAKVRENIMADMRKTNNVKDKFTKKVKNEIAAALMSKKYKQDAIAAVMEVAKRNDISGLEFPAIVDYALELKIDEGDFFFNSLRKVERNKFFYGEIDHTNAEEIAKQWDKASVTAKDVQALALSGKTINTAYVYKRQRLAQEDMDAAEVAGAYAELQRDLRQELRTMVEVGATRAILIGDTVNAEGQKITTFETIGTKTETDLFTTVINPEDSDVTILDLARAAEAVKTETKWLVISGSMLLTLRQFKYAGDGDVTLKSIDELAAQIGVDRIIKKDYLNTIDGLHAIVLDPNEYWVREVKTLDLVYPEYEKNAINFQFEKNMGGAIHGLQSTAVLRAAANDD